MRNNIVHQGAGELTYEIRGIVEVAEKIKNLGQEIYWENIGDPVAKGYQMPEWIKELVKKEIGNNKSFAYNPTKGLLKTREFLARERNAKNGAKITADDICFFNGLGDAISKVYTYLRKECRVIGPSPAYSTHSSAEAAHAGYPHITYNLIPEKNWLPDLKDLENKIKYNPAISGILIINPDNPTGMVYPKKVLQEMVKLAKKYDLFIISDEIYCNVAHEPKKMATLAEVIGDVPGIAMKGISKEFPWPGSRCGWIEVYNKDKDAVFAKYVKSVLDAKMLEVCSTTLPQSVIPAVMSDNRYETHLKERREFYKKRAEKVHKIFKGVPGIVSPKTAGAFYVSAVFADEVLKNNQKLKISNDKVRKFVEEKTANGLAPDKRFAYYLLGATGICVVPLSGFNCNLPGFRSTLLETDENKFEWIYETLAEKIKKYLGS
ncbi:MAG: pyridoxal phosphate-dependent aminotransferase [Candidatus Pacebacteria bacterium]|nr:pyridoxal phosphate-dependent aminotransferase [Candidatus Paceibacterota bacterium]NUQ57727.1 pyridoxal phosphate-dependent aminotransferase [Candidatus Paceibacter sp.]